MKKNVIRFIIMLPASLIGAGHVNYSNKKYDWYPKGTRAGGNEIEKSN